MDRVPFQATAAGALYEGIGTLPVAVLLDNVRSMYNVGAFFRTADAASLEKLYLCGITAARPRRRSPRRRWARRTRCRGSTRGSRCRWSRRLRARGYEIAAVETSVHAVDLFDWQPRFPVCVVFGHEVDGIRPEISALCDTHVRIPMLGTKHSLNVATAGGVVIYELLRKYRACWAYDRSVPDPLPRLRMNLDFMPSPVAGTSGAVHPRSLPVQRRHAGDSAAAGGVPAVLRRAADGARSARGAGAHHRRVRRGRVGRST